MYGVQYYTQFGASTGVLGMYVSPVDKGRLLENYCAPTFSSPGARAGLHHIPMSCKTEPKVKTTAGVRSVPLLPRTHTELYCLLREEAEGTTQKFL